MDRCPKQPIIALYFESETVLKFYNREAWATAAVSAKAVTLSVVNFRTSFGFTYIVW